MGHTWEAKDMCDEKEINKKKDVMGIIYKLF